MNNMQYKFARFNLYSFSLILMPIFFGFLIWIITDPSFLKGSSNDLEYIWLLLIFLIPFFILIYYWVRVGLFRLLHPVAIQVSNTEIIYYKYTGEIRIDLKDLNGVSTSSIYGGSNMVIIPKQCINLILKEGCYIDYQKYGKLFLGTLEYGAPVKGKDKDGTEIFYIQIPLWGLELHSQDIYLEIKDALGLPENNSLSRISLFLTSGSI